MLSVQSISLYPSDSNNCYQYSEWKCYILYIFSVCCVVCVKVYFVFSAKIGMCTTTIEAFSLAIGFDRQALMFEHHVHITIKEI